MRWFVTGTDTEVGKTVVAACLAQAARDQGSVRAAKPIASGVTDGPGDDASLLGRAAGHPPLVHATFTAPLSPHRAAALEGRSIDPSALRAFLEGLNADQVIVEGVGGWRVPLALQPRLEVADLARWTGGPVVVVAADRLGVLNHTLLTVDAVRSAGLPLAGVVLNRGLGSAGPSGATNLADLRELLDVPVVPLPPFELHDPSARRARGSELWCALGLYGARP